MNWASLTLWGFAGAIAEMTVSSVAQGMGLTRMSIPYLLGTMFTADRDRAKVLGVVAHLLNAWLFAAAYAAIFASWGGAGWGRGALLGLAHGSFILTAGMRALPGLHPRMAGEEQGPEAVRVLEPPGFLAMNYGSATPLVTLAAHGAYGLILGAFYTLPR